MESWLRQELDKANEALLNAGDAIHDLVDRLPTEKWSDRAEKEGQRAYLSGCVTSMGHARTIHVLARNDSKSGISAGALLRPMVESLAHGILVESEEASGRSDAMRVEREPAYKLFKEGNNIPRGVSDYRRKLIVDVRGEMTKVPFERREMGHGGKIVLVGQSIYKWVERQAHATPELSLHADDGKSFRRGNVSADLVVEATRFGTEWTVMLFNAMLEDPGVWRGNAPDILRETEAVRHRWFRTRTKWDWARAGMQGLKRSR